MSACIRSEKVLFGDKWEEIKRKCCNRKSKIVWFPEFGACSQRRDIKKEKEREKKFLLKENIIAHFLAH